MNMSMLRHLSLVLPLSACCLLAGCGNVRLQTVDEFTDSVAATNYQKDRQDCLQQSSELDRQDCLRRTTQAYDEWRADQDKRKNTK